MKKVVIVTGDDIVYSRNNIKRAIADGHLKIIPYEENNLTGIGYNISTTDFAFSINRGLLLKINTYTTQEGYIHYVEIPANDTVLFFSKEYLETDNTIAGTFHSKVSRVCQGLGHISTTLDPMWKGQLIISVNNPNNHSVHFELDKDSGNMFTLLLFKLDEYVTGENIHDNNQGRCDLLLSHFENIHTNSFIKKILTTLHLKKHLELESFIVNEYANSLNAYDNFLVPDINDKYSKKVEQLLELKKQIQNDKVIIAEKRYNIGNEGRYKILRDDIQKGLLRECSIFKLKERGEDYLEQSYVKQQLLNESEKIIDMIEEYAMIIQYELETINHKRRIIWQNKETEKYAKADSRINTYKKIKRKIIKLILFIVFPGGCFAGIHLLCSKGVIPTGEVDKEIIKNLISGIVSIIIFIITIIINEIFTDKE